MQITVNVPDQVAARAQALGLPLEQYVRELLEREATSPPGVAKLSSPEASRAWLDKLAQFSDEIPELPDEAFTRESFYQDHD